MEVVLIIAVALFVGLMIARPSQKPQRVLVPIPVRSQRRNGIRRQY
jgi:hypothetical protein